MFKTVRNKKLKKLFIVLHIKTFFKFKINKRNIKKYLTKLLIIYIMFKATEFISSGGVKMKRTFQPNNRKRSKKMGFMARMKTKMINARRRKGRKVLSH